MKTLLLMRHAKSSWKQLDLEDHERPLNHRGLKDAPRMGKLLFELELLPQLVLSSSAVRSRETVEEMVKVVDFKGEATYLDEFFMAEPEVYLDALRKLPDSLERVMVLGHNPGLEGLLNMLTGRIEPLPTGSIAYITLPIKRWDELDPVQMDTAELVEIWRPKELLDKDKDKAKEKDKEKEKEKSKGKEKEKSKEKEKPKPKEKAKKKK